MIILRKFCHITTSPFIYTQPARSFLSATCSLKSLATQSRHQLSWPHQRAHLSPTEILQHILLDVIHLDVIHIHRRKTPTDTAVIRIQKETGLHQPDQHHQFREQRLLISRPLRNHGSEQKLQNQSGILSRTLTSMR